MFCMPFQNLQLLILPPRNSFFTLVKRQQVQCWRGDWILCVPLSKVGAVSTQLNKYLECCYAGQGKLCSLSVLIGGVGGAHKVWLCSYEKQGPMKSQ